MMTGLVGLIENIKERSFQYSSEPKFKLVSGAVSNFYFNLKKTTQSPDGMYLTGRIFFEKIRELGLHPHAIGGLTMGADPYSVCSVILFIYCQRTHAGFCDKKGTKGAWT
jgi:orotate phosphoribosyltransferase